MAEQSFIDQIKIYCRSGNGGPGKVYFHRDKFTSKGGPAGGDGGRGGHIKLRGNHNIWTLLHLRYRKHIYASNGEPGGKDLKTGADGKDIILDVPLGTIARRASDGTVLTEITEDGETKIILEGGKGGLGNFHFKSPTNQTPRYAQPGIPCQEEEVIFELKILADVGLVGFPNAGKSTLLSTLSAATPKIADYPFTTLTPNVGVVKYQGDLSFVMADIPGIIEGAAEGKGLGLKFLRHIERNAVLLFMVSAEHLDIQNQYNTLLEELARYNPSLLSKRRVLAITKADILDEELMDELKKDLPDIHRVFISSVSGKGIKTLKNILWEQLCAEG